MATEAPVISLKEYISENKGDDCGNWEYCHTPHIEFVLKNLNEQDSLLFCDVIWEWSKFHLFELADPILFCGNKHIDCYFLYTKIFSMVDDIEHLDYLAENLRAVILNSKMRNMDIQLLDNVKQNLVKVIEATENILWVDAHSELVCTLAEEIKKKQCIK